jgi:hypothetical protein
MDCPHREWHPDDDRRPWEQPGAVRRKGLREPAPARLEALRRANASIAKLEGEFHNDKPTPGPQAAIRQEQVRLARQALGQSGR